MLNQIRRPPAGPLPREAHRRREDALAALARLHGARDEGFPVADALDVVEDGDLRVAGEDKVAVHAVDCEVRRDGRLRRGEALRDGGAAEDAARPRRVPEGPGVGVDVGADVGEGQEGEDGFDGRVRGVRGEGFDEGVVFGHGCGCGCGWDGGGLGGGVGECGLR